MTSKKIGDFLEQQEIQTATNLQQRLERRREELKYRIVGFYRETEFQDTPIGKMPKSWKITKLANVAQIIMGQSPPSSTYNEEGIGLPFL